MAAFLSLVPVRGFASVSAVPVRARLRLVHHRPLSAAARPVAAWHRAADGRLVCHWQPADPDPLP
ncbi:MAG: hypothetical protein JWO51_3576 [Rhodospirillales bacterium]|jgi:hypothetical protein|nr:hypothetical protein [Rhodospirillales bacterium]